MSQNWVTNLDLCAMNGIIDYDGGAYLRGLPPRYVGNPRCAVPPMCPPPGGKPALPPQAPVIDKLDLTQKSSENTNTTETCSKKKSQNWKKILFAGITIGSLIFLGYKFRKTKFMKGLGKFFKKPIKSIKTNLQNFWNWLTKPLKKGLGTTRRTRP